MRRLAYTTAALALAAAAVLLGNYVLVHRHLATAIDSDPRNNGIVAFAHYDYFVLPGTLVFDLRSVGNTNSPLDVFRVLLQFSATQKDSEYSLVKLSLRGDAKFLLQGGDFRTLGSEFGTQNPVYTIRTFPEKLYRPDGVAAFDTWTGGVLGVLGKQMGDFADFHKQWYITELSKTSN